MMVFFTAHQIENNNDSSDIEDWALMVKLVMLMAKLIDAALSGASDLQMIPLVLIVQLLVMK